MLPRRDGNHYSELKKGRAIPSHGLSLWQNSSYEAWASRCSPEAHFQTRMNSRPVCGSR